MLFYDHSLVVEDINGYEVSEVPLIHHRYRAPILHHARLIDWLIDSFILIHTHTQLSIVNFKRFSKYLHCTHSTFAPYVGIANVSTSCNEHNEYNVHTTHRVKIRALWFAKLYFPSVRGTWRKGAALQRQWCCLYSLPFDIPAILFLCMSGPALLPEWLL